MSQETAKFESAVVAVYESVGEAKRGVAALKKEGFPKGQISLVAHSLEDEKELHGFISHGDRTETDAARGAAVGGIFGALMGAAFFWVPGFGPLILLGPLATGAAGSVVGTLVGAMTGWGIPEDHVGNYEAALKQGKLLVIAHGSPLKIAEAKSILTDTHPKEVHLHSETSEDADEIDDSPARNTAR